MPRSETRRVLTGTMWIGMLVLAGAGRAAETSAPGPAGPAAWQPPLYGFCMEIFDAQKRPLPEQAQLLRELGFAGAGYPLWLDDSLDKNTVFGTAGDRRWHQVVSLEAEAWF